MKYSLPYGLLSAVLFLSGCGGSEDPIRITPEPVVTLQVSNAEQQFFGDEGDAIPVVFEGTWGAANLGSNSVYIQAIDEEGNIVKTAISESLEGESFTLHTVINDTLEVGDYTSTVSLVACKDRGCNSIYDNPFASVNVQISVEITPEPIVTLQVSSAEQQFFSNEGDALPVVFEGTWSAANLGSNSVYIQAIDEEGDIIKTAISESLEEESFTLHTAINHTLEVGDYTSTVSLVACKDRSCNNIYDNSNASVDVQINVKPVPEWQTHQGNAAHNGYVPIWLNHHEFEKLWEWQFSGNGSSINAPVSGNGEVFVTSDMGGMDINAIIALDAFTGEERWRIKFDYLRSMNPPAINRDTLFVSTSNVGDNKIWAIDRAEGKHKYQANFDTAYGGYFAPTIHDDVIYHTGGGYQGGSTFAFSSYGVRQVWSQSQGSSFGADTPAVDNEHVYVHDGGSLSILDKSSGELIRSINDPLGIADYHYWGSPVVGSSNNVLAFARGNTAGTPNTSAEHWEDRVISNFDIVSAEYRWSSEFSYKTFFATSNGVVYAGRNPARSVDAIDETASLDAIDETTGEILWSWVAPSSEDKSFHRNVVVTKNLLFVSTNAHIYAIDLDTKQAVWSYDEPGVITISDDRILFLAVGYTYGYLPRPMNSDGRLIAFDLRSK